MHSLQIKMAFAFIFSFLITFYLIPFFRSLARRINFVDIPDGTIKLHKQTTPYMGGVAVYCGFLFGLAFTMPFENKIFLLLVGATLLLFTGLIDDFFVLKPYQKFFAQLIIASCFLKAGFYLKGHFFYNIWHIPLSFLWIVTIINAFNLIDVMDGLATTVAICATLNFIAVAFLFSHNNTIILLLSLLGGLCGFLWYNKPPATIYLGDAGSLFIGGILAVVPFLYDWGTYNVYGYLTPIIILAIPLLECVSLILIRWHKGIPFYQGSPDHFCMYLRKNNWSNVSILIYMALLSLYQGVVSFLFVSGRISLPEVLILGALFLIVWFFYLMRSS